MVAVQNRVGELRNVEKLFVLLFIRAVDFLIFSGSAIAFFDAYIPAARIRRELYSARKLFASICRFPVRSSRLCKRLRSIISVILSAETFSGGDHTLYPVFKHLTRGALYRCTVFVDHDGTLFR